MDYTKLAKSAKKRLPLILSFLASAGVAATAITALKAHPEKPAPDATAREKATVYLKNYGPTVLLATSTIVCIFGAHALAGKRQATLASAYTLLYSSYNEYKEKVKELYGEDAHRAVMDAIVKEKCEDVTITACGIGSCSSLSIDESNLPEVVRTFYEPISERYFESTLSRVMEAEYHLNRNFILGALITLNDFYEFLGLPPTDYGKTAGWYVDDDIYWIDFDHRIVEIEDVPESMEVCVIYSMFEPRLISEYDI